MDFIAQYNLTGLVIGLATFLIIGVFHPLVIKGEYHFGVRIWWAFLLMGLAAIAASVAVRHVVWSTLPFAGRPQSVCSCRTAATDAAPCAPSIGGADRLQYRVGSAASIA